MQEPPGRHISPGAYTRDAFSSLVRAPFRGLLMLSVFVSLVSNTIPAEGDQAGLVAALVLIAASLYLQIAATLAAAELEPDRSTDAWLKRAFARRCFWRYVLASVLVLLLVVLAGVLGLIVGGFIVGGIAALTDPAVVLERRTPLAAIARSAELGKPARLPLIVIFGGLVLVPGISVQVGDLVWDLRKVFGPAWPALPVIVLILGFAGAIALTRAFVALGGRRTPPEDLRAAPRERL